jgi:hypothetical protein
METRQTRAEPDQSRINVEQPKELQYWSDRLGTTPERLKEIVERVGPSPRFIAKLIQR